MSHFSLDSEISNALRMDAPINRGPMMRWQRKQAESETNQSINASLNASCGTSKTPLKNANKSLTQPKTPSGGSGGRKTPKSGGMTEVTV